MAREAREDLVQVAAAGGVFGEVEGAVVAHFVGGAEECAKGSAGKRTADADAPDAEGGEGREVERRIAKAGKHVDRTVDRANDGFDIFLAGEAGSVEDVGTGFLIGLQALDGVSEVLTAMQVVFGARGKREGEREGAGGFGRGLNALCGEADFVNGVFGAAGIVFDGATDEAGGGGEADGFGAFLRGVAEAVFEIGADGQINRGCDGGDVLHHGVTTDAVIGFAGGKGEAGGGSGERFKAEVGEEAGGAGVPGVGDDEGSVALVEGAEGASFVGLSRHGVCTDGAGLEARTTAGQETGATR